MARKTGKKGLDKKGSVLDLIIIAAGILIFSTAALFGFKIVNSFNDNVQTNNMMPAEAKTVSTEMQGHYTGIIDNSIIFLLLGMTVGAFILASLVRVHPIFIPLFIVSLIFIIFFCSIYSNIYTGMAETANLESEASQLTTITYVLTYLPFIVGILGTILMLIMYKLGADSL